MWLGLLEELPPEMCNEIEFELDRGDLLLLYTDGITEHFKGDEMFGEDRLRAVFQASAKGDLTDISDVIEQLVNALDDFSAEPRRDDVTMLIIDHRGDAAAPPA